MKTNVKIPLASILLGLVITACSPTLKPGDTSDYYEDLTPYRPVYAHSEYNHDSEIELLQGSDNTEEEEVPFAPEFDITHRLDSLLDEIAFNNQQLKYIQGYTIQVYTGNSQEEANEAKAKVYQILPESRPQVTYDLPNYKVKVGKYYYRLQAQKEFAVVKKEFPSAILAPQQFEIN